jgi:hypothetical protein
VPWVQVEALEGRDLRRLADLDGDVRHQLCEFERQAIEGFGDDGFELFAVHCSR